MEVQSEKETIRLFAIDDNRLFLESLSFLLNLEKGIEVVGMSTKVRGVLPLIREARPDIILLDVVLADGDGLVLLEEIREELAIPVIMLSLYEEYQAIALKKGAQAYVVKGGNLGVLHQIIFRVYAESKK